MTSKGREKLWKQLQTVDAVQIDGGDILVDWHDKGDVIEYKWDDGGFNLFSVAIRRDEVLAFAKVEGNEIVVCDTDNTKVRLRLMNFVNVLP